MLNLCQGEEVMDDLFLSLRKPSFEETFVIFPRSHHYMIAVFAVPFFSFQLLDQKQSALLAAKEIEYSLSLAHYYHHI